jgi:glycosyltransferase involved in cell wall biosynthesis
MARVNRLRVWDELRTAYIEWLAAMEPGTLLYRRRNYDFDVERARSIGAIEAGVWRSIWVILTSDYDLLELNEPLWVRRWTVIIPYLAAARIRALLRHKKTKIVAYAMENNNIPEAIQQNAPCLGRLAAGIARWLFPIVAGRFTRIAFATRAAQDNYELLGLPQWVERETILLIPTACDCLQQRHKELEVLFLSALEPHKGVLLMFEAWSSLRQFRIDTGYTLRVVGKGSLEACVQDLAREAGDVTVEVDPPRERVHELLRRATVVVLLSQPYRYWKEQVGLSITEGLAHGCTIVTTDQTGLAPWLQTHGHMIIPSAGTLSTVADLLTVACQHPLDPAAVLASLNDVDGRYSADSWLARGSDVSH